jgi:hypothetical protein
MRMMEIRENVKLIDEDNPQNVFLKNVFTGAGPVAKM